MRPAISAGTMRLMSGSAKPAEYWNLGTDPGHELGMVEPHVGRVTLEVGCGMGRLSHALAGRHPARLFIGYDPEPSFLAAARENSLPNEQYSSVWPTVFDAAYTVLVFQHLTDMQVVEIVGGCHPRPFRFQFVLGNQTARHHYQRSQKQMRELCAPYTVRFEDDPVYREWSWGTAW